MLVLLGTNEQDYFILATITLLTTVIISMDHGYTDPGGVFFLGQLVRQIYLAWILWLTILAVLGYVTKTSDMFSRRVLLTWFFLVPLALVALRLQVYLGLRWLRESGFNSRMRLSSGRGTLVGGWEKMSWIPPG